ncbi:anti-sigma factor [Falsirhodobacter halotolerans]|uniref:anti-sigma factor n=1 Tax=Falsirhodobacter halotolerans TaxID=1146892 RepID=UPI001FD53435|nr:anti-sigma factor [Falsirhodobacter halotolerans]MCJ8141190.1 anti-sigma factor [Falsirhodobacter halotolerans]
MSRDIDDLADTFVLGLCDADDAARLEAKLSRDAQWAQAVGRARDRFLPLDQTAPAVTLPDDLWDRIAPQIGAVPPAANRPFAPRLRRFLPTAVAAAVALMVGLYLGGRTLGPEPVVVAVLMDEAGAARAIVEDYGHETARIRFVSDVAVPEGRQMQVWTLPSTDRGPVSLGLLNTDRTETLAPPTLPVPADGQLYEITLEPLGGSPTDRPTGAILAKGFAARQDRI